MIKFIIGFIIGYYVVSVYGPSVIFDFIDTVGQTIEGIKEATNK